MGFGRPPIGELNCCSGRGSWYQIRLWSTVAGSARKESVRLPERGESQGLSAGCTKYDAIDWGSATRFW